MIDHYPNPWNFDNSEGQFISIDGVNSLEYSDLNEVGMGAPLGGKCDWINDVRRVPLGTWCAGPAIWNREGNLAAIPIWTRSFWKGTHQKLTLLNSRTGELTTFKSRFAVIDLRSFDNAIIYGYDSPIHKRQKLTFKIESEKIESIQKLI